MDGLVGGGWIGWGLVDWLVDCLGVSGLVVRNVLFTSSSTSHAPPPQTRGLSSWSAYRSSVLKSTSSSHPTKMRKISEIVLCSSVLCCIVLHFFRLYCIAFR